MRLQDFDFTLPDELIAQHPLDSREASRMLILDRSSGQLSDDCFSNLPALLRGDELIVLNNARVIPARLFARRQERVDRPAAQRPLSQTKLLPARIEVLLVRRLGPDEWEALVRPGRKIRTGETLQFENSELQAEVTARGEYGLRHLRFTGPADFLTAVQGSGHIPLPPYIRRADEPADRERYQTVFAKRPGAVAAPTAGLHFTPDILQRIRSRGVEICEITLDVGLGTFQPIHGADVNQHVMHTEDYEIPADSAEAIARARQTHRPILAIGTTVVRALEDAAQKATGRGAEPFQIAAGRASSNIFIKPGHRFALIDQLLTNFHLPRSTLLMLVSSFATREHVLKAYAHAIAERYRFYSYGDCMLIR